MTSPATPNVQADRRLARLAADRDIALARLIEAACDLGIGALIQVGSLGRGHGDNFSDLDLIAVPIRVRTPRDICVAAFGDQIVATITVARNAPTGGGYQAVCIATTDGAVWIDLYVVPRPIAVVPADASIVFDHLGLARDRRAFAELLAAHTDPTRPAHPEGGATTLLRVSVAAKYLARGEHARMTAKLPQTARLPIAEAPTRMHAILDAIGDPELGPAVTAVRGLVDLATAHTATSASSAGSHR